MGEIGSIGVGRRQGEIAGGDRAVAGPARTVGRRRSGTCHAVPRPREGHDLVFAGDELGHPDRRLVGLRAGAQQQHLVEGLGQGVRQAGRQFQNRGRDHPAEQVIELADLPGDGRDDVGMRVPEDRRHLTRGEVEQLSSVGGVDPAARRPDDHLRREPAAVADEIAGVDAGGALGLGGHDHHGTSGAGLPRARSARTVTSHTRAAAHRYRVLGGRLPCGRFPPRTKGTPWQMSGC